MAPLPLAIERTFECEILSQKAFTTPVLDIGCGDGLFSKILFKEKIDVGIDPQAQEIAHARQTNSYIQLIQCYGNNLPFPDKHFNTVFSNSVMEHIPDIKPVLVEAHRVLADAGCIYLTLPTDNFDKYSVIYQFLKLLGMKNLAEKYSRFFNAFWKHYHYYNLAGWTELFQSTGFKVSEHTEYLPKGSAVFNDLCSPFSLFSFIQKKFFNTWFLFPFLRGPFAIIYFYLYKNVIFKKVSEPGSGGLIYFKLQKL